MRFQKESSAILIQEMSDAEFDRMLEFLSKDERHSMPGSPALRNFAEPTTGNNDGWMRLELHPGSDIDEALAALEANFQGAS